MESFRDAVAVVTGAASGIGAALAVQLASEGAHLVLADVNSSEETERAVRAAGAKVLSVSTDVSNRVSVENLAEQAYSTFGRVNLLCNNAGVVLLGPMAEISEDQWDWILAINVKGVINGVSVFLPRMLAQTDARHVLNTVSGAGLVASGVLPLGAYTTSKFAAMGFTESLRNELAPRGIGVTALCPGSVETRILDSAQYTDSVGTLRPPTTGAPTPTREGIRRMSPYEVAALALAGC